MKKKINLVVLLLTGCVILMLALQLYFNYNAYHNNKRAFRIGVDGALKQSVTKLMNMRRDEFATQYKNWLLDTNLIALSLQISGKDTLFSIRDKNPTDEKYRPPFRINLPRLNVSSAVMTPEVRKKAVDYFVKNFLYNDFNTGRVLFFTTSLGDRQHQAFDDDRVNLTRLKQIYKQELAKEQIDAQFELLVKDYSFTKFDSLEKDSLGTAYVTHPSLYGFGKQVNVVATFPDVAKANLSKIKWLIFSSLILMAITIACFAYTLKTMLSQKKLAALKDDFVNNMTHELKTPIATISIAAEAITDFQVNKTAAEEYLSIIKSQAKNMSNLIEQLLNSLLIEQTSFAVKLEKVSFNEIIRQSLQQYQPQLQLSNATVVTDLTEDELLVKGDQTHLTNVMANLIDNAIKYSKGEPEIGIKLYRHDRSLVFEISNTTDEIADHYANRLFEKFFRVPKGNLHEVKGYGLGLNYVAHVVKQHDGKIKVNTQKDRITFSLTLPLYERA